jgi:hypothetical protein
MLKKYCGKNKNSVIFCKLLPQTISISVNYNKKYKFLKYLGILTKMTPRWIIQNNNYKADRKIILN